MRKRSTALLLVSLGLAACGSSPGALRAPTSSGSHYVARLSSPPTVGPARPLPPDTGTVVVPSSGTVASSGTGYASPASTTAPVSPGPSSTTASTSPPCQSGTVTVNGQEGTEPAPVCLHPGSRLVVNLAMNSSAGGQYWTVPQSSDQTVLPRVSGSATPEGGSTASFDAHQSGQATVTATTDAPCFHAQPPCGMAQYLWRLEVTVK
jgi:hypothetical protein